MAKSPNVAAVLGDLNMADLERAEVSPVTRLQPTAKVEEQPSGDEMISSPKVPAPSKPRAKKSDKARSSSEAAPQKGTVTIEHHVSSTSKRKAWRGEEISGYVVPGLPKLIKLMSEEQQRSDGDVLQEALLAWVKHQLPKISDTDARDFFSAKFSQVKKTLESLEG